MLWGSTSTKDPAYKPTRYVDSLIAENTVSTMPESTIEAFAREGTLEGNAIEKQDLDPTEVVENLVKVGIDLEYVSQRLEDEGIQKFISPFMDAHESIKEQTHAS